MMRTILIIILMIFPVRAIAPVDNSLIILKQKAIDPLEVLWRAVCIVESNNDSKAINVKEGAYGIAQIRKCRINHYNRLTGENYKHKDAFNPVISKEIFYYYALEIGNDYERIAREWNGGPKGMQKKQTVDYWQKIKRYL